jgi:hypothetical protein
MWGCSRWPDCDLAKDIDPADEPRRAEEMPFEPPAVVASMAAVVVIAAIFRLPLEPLFWTKGVEGERRTAAFIEPLPNDGHLVLCDRLLPVGRGDIDSLLVGPTGIFVIETKNWGKTVEAKGHRLFAGGSDRTWAIEQTYREALAVQLALSDELTALRITVASVSCLPGGIRGGRCVVSPATPSRTP